MRRDQREANRRYYREHRDEEIERVRRRQDARLFVLSMLRWRPCMDCGIRYEPHQMDHDHREPDKKSFQLTSGAALLAPRPVVAAELRKCDVVCANCHRTRTRHRTLESRARTTPSESPGTLRMRQIWRSHATLLRELRDVPCFDCGGRYPTWAMDFDHREPGEKRATVSRMIGRASVARILEEVAKCDIVCATCHRDRTKRRREGALTLRE